MLNSARECPDIDLYVYFVCALAFPFRDPSTLPSLTSRSSPFRPIPLFRPAIPSSDALSSQLHIGSPLTLRVQLSPHHRDATPAPDRPVTDAIDAPTRPTTTAATNSRSSPCLNVHHLEMVVFFVSVFFVSAIKDMGYVGDSSI